MSENKQRCLSDRSTSVRAAYAGRTQRLCAMAVSVVRAGLIPARFSLSFRQQISRKSATANSPNRYASF